MTIATARLTDAEHQQFSNDIGHPDWNMCVTVAREGDTTTVSNKGNLPTGADGRYFFCRSLKDGLLRTWGYHKKFTVIPAAT